MRNQNAKVEAVVKSLIKIRSEDGEAKSLVFSTWTGFHLLALKQVLFLWFSSFGIKTSVISLVFRRVGYSGGSLG